jgi:hypothetical protein
MKYRRSVFLLAVVLVVSAGCDSGRSSRQPAQQKVPKLSGLPADVTVSQRSTTVVPGSDGLLRVTIDDITRGQVMTSLAGKDGGVVLAATSLAAGDKAAFRLGEQTYELTLKELNNALVGDDFAIFTISLSAEEGATSEAANIEQLLAAVAAAQGDVFIRNGSEHTAAEAADHLRTKWKAAGGNIASARQFVDEIASTSSLSGEPYRVRRADGTEVSASEYLRDKLEQIEARVNEQ